MSKRKRRRRKKEKSYIEQRNFESKESSERSEERK